MIAVDICNTLADVNSVLEKYFGKIPEGSYHHPAVNADFFRFHPDIFREALPLPKAAESVTRIALSERILYLTARPLEAKEATIWFLEHYGFPKADILFSTEKAKMAARYNFQRAIDDSPSEIVKYKNAGIPVAVYRQHYNRQFTGRFTWGEDIIYEI